MGFFFQMLLLIGVLVYICIRQEQARIRKEEERARKEEVYRIIDKNTNLLYKAIDAKSSRTVNNYLSQAEANYYAVSHLASGTSREWLESDIESIRNEVESRKKEEWETKAGKIRDKLIETYYMIIEYNFDSVDRAYKAKEKCLKYWDQYWRTVDECDVMVNPKQFLKLRIYEDDHSFDSAESLRRRLDQAINEMKPEYQRKMRLYKRIMDSVAEKGTVMRCELLKTQYPDANVKEIECCYKELVRKYRLVEVKIGNRYFVSLSDKELEKRNQK